MPAAYSGVVELRQYTLKPCRRDELIGLFEREFIESQEVLGMTLFGLFRDADHPDRFVWLRGFSDMLARREALSAFYGGPVWQAHGAAANDTMIDSDNVMLLRPAQPGSGFDSATTRVSRPLLCLAWPFSDSGQCSTFANHFLREMPAHRITNDGTPLAAFVTETSTNTYPKLPVREGEHNFVVFTSGVASHDLLRGSDGVELIELLPTSRSRIQLVAEGSRP
jgi:hypothetical protein